MATDSMSMASYRDEVTGMTTTQLIFVIIGAMSLSYHICRFIFWLDAPRSK